MARKITMTEIAAACGVSQATVSLVLNNAPGTRISSTTRELVLRTAKDLGYVPPARTAGRRPVIAMLIDEVTSTPHVGGLIAGVAAAANDAGFLVSVMPTAADGAAERAALSFLAQLPVAGVIYARLVTQEVTLTPRVTDYPCILLNCYEGGDRVPAVIPGDQAAGVTAVLSLLDAGHRRIAYIGGEDSIEASVERLKGYRRALATRDVPYDPSLVVKGGYTIAGGHSGMKRLLTLADPPTAVFCFCDRTALGVYTVAAEAGLTIGRDLSVIGFDNEAFTADMAPPLTTMVLPHADMARHAVDELVSWITQQKPPARPNRLKFDCQLITRASTGPLLVRQPA